MSKLAKLYLAAAAAQVSNEDIEDSAFPNLGSNDAPASDAQPEGEPALTAARPDDAAPAETVDEPVVEQSEAAANTVAATEDATVDEATGNVVETDEADANFNDEDASSDRATDFVEARTVAREEREALESLQASLEGLKDIHQLLGHLNATGGVSKDVMSFAHIGLEAYTDTLGLPAIMLGVSLESFEEVDQRQEVSLEHLEYLIEQCEAIVPEVQQNITVAQENLTNRASMESLQFGGESACSDDMDATTLAAGQNEAARERELEATAEASTAVDGIERVRDEVVAQNEAGGLSQEALVAASLALEAFTKPLGLPEVALAENLDAFAAGARVQVSTEAIDIAMEGAMDVVKKMGKAIAARARKTMIFVKNALGMLNGTLPKTIEALEKFLADLDPKAKTSGTVSASGLIKKLHDGGKVPSNIPQYLIDFCGFAGRFMGPYMVAAQRAMADNIAAIHKLPFNNAPAFHSALGDLARTWKDPRSALHADDLKATIPGEGRVFSDREPMKYKGDVEEVKFFIDLATHNVLHGTVFREERKLADATKTLPAMSVSEIKRVGEQLLKLLKSINTSHLEVHSNVIEDYWTVDALLIEAPIKAARKEANVVREAFFRATLMPALEFGWSMARSCVTVARTFMKYAQASLATVSTESFEDGVATGAEEISMEGADPKKLKSGVKVKFSHGHGKIAKVFTAPFLFAKKHHHASKDEPRYLVKADKGGHQSVHKASALTLV